MVTSAPTTTTATTAAPSSSDPTTTEGAGDAAGGETLPLTGIGSSWPLAALGLVLLSVGLVIVVSQRARIQASAGSTRV